MSGTLESECIPKELGSTAQAATFIELSWSVSKDMLPDVDHFDIRYHPQGQIKWKSIATNENNTTYLITELESDTYYEFKLRSVLPNGDESPFSQTSVFQTLPLSLGTIRQEVNHMSETMETEYLLKELGGTNQTATTIELSWSVAENVLPEIDHFDIRYHPRGQMKWKSIVTNENNTTYLITELKSDTYYEFKLRSVLPDGDESPFTQTSVFKTMASPVGICQGCYNSNEKMQTSIR